MSEVLSRPAPQRTVKVVYGQRHKFMLIPIMEHNARFVRAGPVTFGVEGRVLGDRTGRVGEIGASLHVFNADRSEEWLRFDCFDRGPHYHYILHLEGHNIVWGYDPAANGPMAAWALNAVRTRLPEMLRKAGAATLAAEVERTGVDPAALEATAAALAEEDRRIRPGSLEMIEEGIEWMARWKRLHPQFNTVDDDE